VLGAELEKRPRTKRMVNQTDDDRRRRRKRLPFSIWLDELKKEKIARQLSEIILP
jgi:hypothetical protein